MWEDKTIRVAGIMEESIVDGPGLRFTIFVQGCPHKCVGCHNPETHDITGGTEVSLGELYDKLHENSIITKVTFSGGEPFLYSDKLISFAEALKSENYHLMAYTGYLYEALIQEPYHRQFLDVLDLLVDGPYLRHLNVPMLKFKGSQNQRIIDLRKTTERHIEIANL